MAQDGNVNHHAVPIGISPWHDICRICGRRIIRLAGAQVSRHGREWRHDGRDNPVTRSSDRP